MEGLGDLGGKTEPRTRYRVQAILSTSFNWAPLAHEEMVATKYGFMINICLFAEIIRCDKGWMLPNELVVR